MSGPNALLLWAETPWAHSLFFLQKDLRSAERLVSNISNAEGTWGPWQPNFDESVTGTAVEPMER